MRYNYSIEYKAGALNEVVDALSHVPIRDMEDEQTHLKSVAIDKETGLKYCLGPDRCHEECTRTS